mgnify:CR=1 FL=1
MEKKKTGIDLETVKSKISRRSGEWIDEHLIKKYSILIPLIQEKDGTLSVVFEKRAATIKQAGDICFPGGKWEKDDESPWRTAKRETSEELGIPEENITCVGQLGKLIHHDRSLIFPFVGWIESGNAFAPNELEVDEVFAVPLQDLLAARLEYYNITFQAKPEEQFPFHLIANGRNYSWRTGTSKTPFYFVGERVIWGLTAKILTHFLQLLRA